MTDLIFESEHSKELLRAIWASCVAQKSLAEAYEVYRAGGLWSFYAAAVRDRDEASLKVKDAMQALKLEIAATL